VSSRLLGRVSFKSLSRWATFWKSLNLTVQVRPDDLHQRLLWLMGLRVGVITILLGATLALNYKSFEDLRRPSSMFLLSAVIITYVLTIIYSIWYRSRWKSVLLAEVQFLFDLLLWTGLVYVTGGIGSGFTFLYHMSVILAAVIFGQEGAVVVAGAASIFLLLLEGTMFGGVLPPLLDQSNLTPVSIGEFFYYGGVNVAALFLVAGLSGNLAFRLERTGAGLEAERRRRADLTALQENIVRSLTSGLLTTDQNLVIRSINPAGMMLLAADPARVIGEKLDTLLPEAAQESKKGELPSLGRGKGHGYDGRVMPVEFNVASLSDAEGKPQGFLVVFQDLSAIAAMEERLERARHLAALGELAAGLAHEIRNPLGSISGVIEIVGGEQEISGSNKDLLKLASKELVRINSLVEQLLTYVRPESLQIVQVDISSLIKEVVTAFKRGGEGEKMEVSLSAEPGLDIFADSFQIRQVLWNLLINAAQHAADGKEIRIAARRQPDGGVLVEVADRGKGIEKDDMARIFEPFFTRKKRGVGLGLSLCRRIIEAHGGRIQVESTPGQGSRFWFTLLPRPPVNDQEV